MWMLFLVLLMKKYWVLCLIHAYFSLQEWMKTVRMNTWNVTNVFEIWKTALLMLGNSVSSESKRLKKAVVIKGKPFKLELKLNRSCSLHGKVLILPIFSGVILTKSARRGLKLQSGETASCFLIPFCEHLILPSSLRISPWLILIESIPLFYSNENFVQAFHHKLSNRRIRDRLFQDKF